MNAVVLFGRLAVWLGCAALIAMAVTGRQPAPVSIVAVALTAVGLAALLMVIPSSKPVDDHNENSHF